MAVTATPGDSADMKRDQVLDSRLLEVRTRFRVALPERIAAIEDALRALQPGDLPRDGIESVRTEVHSLAGSSGLFGLDVVGNAAGDLERLLIAATRQGVLSHADLEEISDAMSRLKRAARTA